MSTFLLVALLLWLMATEAAAQSIEAAGQRLLIGQTPWLRLHLRGFEMDPAGLGPQCVRVGLTQGESPLPDESLQVGLATLGRDGKVQFDVTSSVTLQEPLLHARVELECGAPYTREFSLLVEPAPQAGAEARPAGLGVPVRSGPSPTVRAVAAAMPRAARAPSSPATGTRRMAHSAALPEAGDGPASRARLQLVEPEVDQIVAAVLQALAQRPPMPLRSQESSAAPAGLRPFEADWLRELQRLQEEQRQARAQLAALQLRLERQESETLQRWGALAASVAGLIAASLLLRLLRERRLPRLFSEPDRSTTPRPDGPSGAEPPAPPAGRSAGPWTDTPATHPVAPLGDPPAPPGPQGPTPAAPLEFEPDRSLVPEPVPPDAPWPTAPPPRCAWPGADFGEPSLQGRGSAPALRQVDAMSEAGYRGAAVTLLENALQVRPGKNPWLLLRLLDLYRTMQQPWNHERVSAQLEALYNVRVPPMRPDGQAGGEGRDLLDCPDLLERLAQVWPRPATARDWLHQRLLRDRGLPVVDLATFRDLLLLHDLARELESEVESFPA